MGEQLEKLVADIMLEIQKIKATRGIFTRQRSILATALLFIVAMIPLVKIKKFLIRA